MEVKAKLNRIRMSPRKVRLVIDVIRGLDIEKAQEQLQFISKAAAQPILKLLNSALANAENNFKLDKNNLFIKKITADEGPVLKRYRPRAFGRAAEIRKRSSLIELVLAEKKESKRKVTADKKKSEKEGLKIVKADEIQKETSDPKKKELPTEEKKKKSIMGIGKIKDKFIHRTGEK
ncbi:MAG: 50S ribosomal protein L22 [Candidatus Kerfeldbacteria bacterium CG_4_10_14_0_8_um_filter_42_10]|uniref:Large ribosomal subunit protein uL22 n=1 Tax=Candidatus Kerfeldbacteria bacterium CG_4_10_14_0_8_um_filter_42_10 TaxID=2014248 RepID=A0A2M7RHY0_9BACT|nr:MAG: 50S ribosomal protein L22 [Candidatus Kerfeldbacteria bacterium CG_4_10_14_0_8_um_filter_42_10]